VVNPNKILHDFATSPFVCVNLTLKFSHVDVKTRGKTSAILFEYRVNLTNNQSDHVNWSGATQGVALLPQDQTEPVCAQVSLNVQQYGLYNLGCIEYRAQPYKEDVPKTDGIIDGGSILDYNMEKIMNCDEEFSSVDVCFTVLPKSTSQ
jgi:hypothetical protein